MGYIFDNVKVFASESADLNEAMKTYAQNVINEKLGVKTFSIHTKEEQEMLIDKAYCAEVARKAGVELPNVDNKSECKVFSTHPSVAYYANSITNNMIDSILPMVIDNSALRFIADIRYADYGDTIKFDVENNQLFQVTKAGYRRRRVEAQKSFDATVTMSGENHEITIADNFFNVLIGHAHIARDVMKAAMSMEVSMLTEAFSAFETGMATLPANLQAINFNEKSAIKIAETVTAYNQGRKAIFLGTPVALKGVLPSNSNYRYLLSDEYVKLGHLQTFNGFDVIPMEQVADPYAPTPYSLKFDDSKVYIVSPASDKLVKIGIFGGTMASTIPATANANTEESHTLSKSWDVAVITNSVAGRIDSTESQP